MSYNNTMKIKKQLSELELISGNIQEKYLSIYLIEHEIREQITCAGFLNEGLCLTMLILCH